MDDKVLVVLSHSSYSDLWPSLELQYSRYNICSNFRVFLTTDCVPEPVRLDYFEVLFYPEDLSWLEAFKHVLARLNEYGLGKVIVTFDDLYPTYFNIDAVLKIYDIEEGIWTPLANVPSHKHVFKSFRKKFSVDRNPYSGSLVFSIINVNYFIKTLSEIGEQWTPWQYERNIYNLLDEAVAENKEKDRQIIRYINLVERGYVNKISELILRYKYRLILKSARPCKPLGNSIVALIYRHLWRLMNNLGFVNIRNQT